LARSSAQENVAEKDRRTELSRFGGGVEHGSRNRLASILQNPHELTCCRSVSTAVSY
jgi:hypothetical protein